MPNRWIVALLAVALPACMTGGVTYDDAKGANEESEEDAGTGAFADEDAENFDEERADFDADLAYLEQEKLEEAALGGEAFDKKAIRYVGHNKIPPITTRNDGVYGWYLRYQPALKVSTGCVPFPAVGDHIAGQGLRTNGARNGGCGKSIGQVYARHRDYRGRGAHGIMYAYYFPKDQAALPGTGHRHDWEEIVVWVTWDWKRVIAVSFSGHGGYSKSKKPQFTGGTHVRAHYKPDGGGFGSHRMTSGSGTYHSHPLAAYWRLSAGVRHTLNAAVWMAQDGKQHAEPKIKESKFATYMDKAGFW